MPSILFFFGVKHFSKLNFYQTQNTQSQASSAGAPVRANAIEKRRKGTKR